METSKDNLAIDEISALSEDVERDWQEVRYDLYVAKYFPDQELLEQAFSRPCERSWELGRMCSVRIPAPSPWRKAGKIMVTSQDIADAFFRDNEKRRVVLDRVDRASEFFLIAACILAVAALATLTFGALGFLQLSWALAVGIGSVSFSIESSIASFLLLRRCRAIRGRA